MDHGELRDRLVDIVHGTMDPAVRAELERTVAADEELADDLAFLREARAALTPAPRPIDVDRIVAAVPAYRRTRSVLGQQWRIAAAIGTIAIGGMSLALVQQAVRGDAPSDVVSIVAESALVADVATDGLEITFGQGLTELSDDDVDALLVGLSGFDGLPSAEPVRTVRVDPLTNEGGD
jgi:hypothetical protein